ncbi:MAG: DUF948 domain-containing protein [Actinomycetota bacterium]
MSGGDIALLIAAIAWALLVVGLLFLSLKMVQVLDSTRTTIDSLRVETVPLLVEVRGTVTGVNKELDRADVVMVSAGKIAQSVERITKLVDMATTTPLIKVVSFSYGLQRGLRRFRGEG